MKLPTDQQIIETIGNNRPFCTIDEDEELIRRVTGTMKIIYDLGDADTAACEVNVRRLVDFGWYAPIAKGETL
jgi:hypothetical protein